MKVFTYSVPCGPHRSKCADHWAKEHVGEGPQPYWTWEPSACTLDEVDSAKFCDVMKGRKGLLLVGRLSFVYW